MISYVTCALTALNLDLCVSSVTIRDMLVLVTALAAVVVAGLVVAGSPYTPYTPSGLLSLSPSLPSPTDSSSTNTIQPTSPVLEEMIPFPANQDDSLWPAADEYKTGLGLTFKDADSDIARRMNMVALHTIVYDMDDDFFDFAPPRAGHLEGVEFEELLLDDVADPSLGYWDAMGESEREFTWRTEYGDDSWLFDRPLYTEIEEKKSVWRRIGSGLKKKVLRRRF
ncbi:hypothetical protein AAF712_010035 [Marasmius tenuissimus]|uniref:Uncharacterized protein n=1 Tax=Marasmius tenuissimus TaxID=585030 RepID=A0ABR2ZPR1_9AGAR